MLLGSFPVTVLVWPPTDVVTAQVVSKVLPETVVLVVKYSVVSVAPSTVSHEGKSTLDTPKFLTCDGTMKLISCKQGSRKSTKSNRTYPS